MQRIVLTCSGGPFRHVPRAEFERATPEQALAHPNWKMGSKITVDSATLMNKGFEVLEAHHLYGVSLDRIDVVIHPESIIHSLVEFVDGLLKAQLGQPDMRLPIQYALGYPERLPKAWRPGPIAEMSPLTFAEPRREDFPCLDLAYRAGRQGGALPAVLNAANEVAVELFLAGESGFRGHPSPYRARMDDAVSDAGGDTGGFASRGCRYSAPRLAAGQPAFSQAVTGQQSVVTCVRRRVQGDLRLP